MVGRSGATKGRLFFFSRRSHKRDYCIASTRARLYKS